MSELLSDFFGFLKSPSRQIFNQSTFGDQILEVVKLFVITFLAVIFLVVPLMTLIGADELPNKLSELENLGFDKEWQQHLALFFLAVVFAPILEELIFRFPLKYRRGAIALAVLCVIAVLTNILQLIGLQMYQAMLLSGGVGLAIVLLLIMKLNQRQKLDSFSKRYYPFFFYMAALFFAFAHIFNYELEFDQLWMGPFLVLPQLILGLMLGYVRVKYGLWASMMAHAMNNLIPTIAIILMPEGGFQ